MSYAPCIFEAVEKDVRIRMHVRTYTRELAEDINSYNINVIL